MNMITMPIRKWGNSRAMRLPDKIGHHDDMAIDQNVDVVDKGAYLEIRPSKKKPAETLDDLVARITPENRPDEFDWGPPMGKELW